MSITYPVFLPVSIKSDRFGLNINKAQFSGEFVRNRIAQSHGAGTTDRWEGVYTTPFLGPDQHREMSALLTAMSVDDGTFFAFNPNGRSVIGKHDGRNLLGTDAELEQTGIYNYLALIPILILGFKVTDIISVEGKLWSTDSLSTNQRVIISFFDKDAVQIGSTNNGILVETTNIPTTSKIENLVIPALTIFITLGVTFGTGTTINNRAKEVILTKTILSQTFVSYLKVDGASQTGTTINIKDGAVSINGLVRSGTMLQIETALYELAKRGDTDGSGNATFEIRPAIRSSHPDSEPILVKNPVMIAQLVQTDHPQETGVTSTGVISFAWQEVV